MSDFKRADNYLTEFQLPRRFGVPLREWRRLREEGTGPRFTILGLRRRIWYRECDVEDYVRSRTFKSEDEAQRAHVFGEVGK